MVVWEVKIKRGKSKAQFFELAGIFFGFGRKGQSDKLHDAIKIMIALLWRHLETLFEIVPIEIIFLSFVVFAFPTHGVSPRL